MSSDLTDMVLDEVRSLRAKLSVTEDRPSTRDSSSSVREYSSRPATSTSSMSSSRESRKRPLEEDQELKPFCTKTLTPVLRYSLSNVTYRVNLEALSRVFSQYGRLVKLTRFPNHGIVSGYVQFENVASAEMAMSKLQARNIYHGCCRLHLSATDIVDLTIRRDLEDGDHAADLSARRPLASRNGDSGAEGYGSGDGFSPVSHRVPGRRGDQYHPPARFNREECFQSPPMGIVPDGRDGGSGYEFWRDSPFGSGDGRGRYGRQRGNGGAPPIQNLWPNEAYGGGGGGGAYGPVRQAKTVLFVANLNESKISAERLFMIFGVYCDIMKIKIFYREKSKALIQAVDGGQADTARRLMDGVLLWGEVLSVTFASAKCQEVNIIPGTDERWAKDFTCSNFSHRFRGNFGYKHLQNVTKPIPTLYVSNVPRGTLEEDVKNFFEDSIRNDGTINATQSDSDETLDNDDVTPSSTSSSSSSSHSVLRVQFFPNQESMAFVEMSSVDAAFEAIIKVHNKRIEPKVTRGRPLFVNFSKVHLEDFNKTGWNTLFRG